MKRSHLLNLATASFGALLLAGCATQPVLTKLPADNPANPDAVQPSYTVPPNRLLVKPAGMNRSGHTSGQPAGHQKMQMKSMHHNMMNMKNMNMDHSVKGHGGSAMTMPMTMPGHKQSEGDQP